MVTNPSENINDRAENRMESGSFRGSGSREAFALLRYDAIEAHLDVAKPTAVPIKQTSLYRRPIVPEFLDLLVYNIDDVLGLSSISSDKPSEFQLKIPNTFSFVRFS